jgi:hypothetical protein
LATISADSFEPVVLHSSGAPLRCHVSFAFAVPFEPVVLHSTGAPLRWQV